MTERLDRITALARTVHETERHVAGAGWDGPVRVFALVDADAAVSADPTLSDLVPATEGQFLAVEQEGLPHAETVEDLLAQLAWPPTVDGAAIVVERMVLPPEVEEEVAHLDDEAAVLAYLTDHPKAEDVRIAAGVLRTGETWTALRARSHDHEDEVAGSRDGVPGLIAALQATLEDAEMEDGDE